MARNVANISGNLQTAVAGSITAGTMDVFGEMSTARR